MLERFLPKQDFESYEDFAANFSVTIPEGFNFAYDVIDVLAQERPNKTALVWCDEGGAEAQFTYADIKSRSDQAANVFAAAGIGKGDPVLLLLKRRHEYWPILLALHKLGAIAIPATHLLTTKDIVYRCEAADIAAVVCVDEEQVMLRVDEAEAKLGGKSLLRYKAFVRSAHAPAGLDIAARAAAASAKVAAASPVPWADFNALRAAASASFTPPKTRTVNDDIMLLYFTSGTTGMPKMVRHNFAYPLGHILTAKYWHSAQDGGLHLTVADTGWAKAAWGEDIRPMALRDRYLRVRLRQVCPRGDAQDNQQIPGHHLLRPPDDLPLLYKGRFDEV
ncbi:hypothetical protein AGMMS50267_06340 [Spirochaetia bacterium]|nr:hypothetical protein AGMMS50267_06340 [Spirochaetia bacterium]